jgi:hypothetical protein
MRYGGSNLLTGHPITFNCNTEMRKTMSMLHGVISSNVRTNNSSFDVPVAPPSAELDALKREFVKLGLSVMVQ